MLCTLQASTRTVLLYVSGGTCSTVHHTTHCSVSPLSFSNFSTTRPFNQPYHFHYYFHFQATPPFQPHVHTHTIPIHILRILIINPHIHSHLSHFLLFPKYSSSLLLLSPFLHHSPTAITHQPTTQSLTDKAPLASTRLKPTLLPRPNLAPIPKLDHHFHHHHYTIHNPQSTCRQKPEPAKQASPVPSSEPPFVGCPTFLPTFRSSKTTFRSLSL